MPAEPDEERIEELIAELPEITRELFLHCSAYQAERRLTSEEMQERLSEVWKTYAAIQSMNKES